MAEETAHCIACSPTNPQGLGMRFTLEGDRCVGHYTPTDDHCGWRGVTHGGLLFTALDEVMANWLWLQGKAGFTARSEVRYRAPVPTGTALRLEAWCVSARRRVVDLQATLQRGDTGEVVAEAEARFMLLEGPPTLNP
ncbi:MAG: PaaI family thioesterase [Pseudomonadales bacterium]|jgi:acyl-coenzyme A thioesterase PaaI-like protein|nr:PaaI family thioesterase [Pseudomonadales bacterium]MDA0954778.1 PaaI family thioesterase [Pseudomonadota bacterium]